MRVITIPLWPEESAHSPSADQPRPRVEFYLPDGKSEKLRAAVVVCPGGGYGGLAAHEGKPFAELFTNNGLVGVVLYYRVAPWKFPAPMADACRGLRLVRENARHYGIDPQRVAIMGFSAGGHLAATVGTQPDLVRDGDDDLIAVWPARPDRLILAYPVASFGEFTHLGSVQNLLGQKPDSAMRRQLSNELHVGPQNPPTFLFHTADDGPVPVQNSLLYAEACVKARTSVELHIYPHGPHGVGLAEAFPALKSWSGLLLEWLAEWRS